MRLVLTVTTASLMLAGCAGNSDKLADANLCEPAIPASQAVSSQFLPGVNLPARHFLGGGKLDPDDAMTYACIDAKNNKTNTPQVPNLHKVRLDHLSAI